MKRTLMAVVASLAVMAACANEAWAFMLPCLGCRHPHSHPWYQQGNDCGPMTGGPAPVAHHGGGFGFGIGINIGISFRFHGSHGGFGGMGGYGGMGYGPPPGMMMQFVPGHDYAPPIPYGMQ